MAGLYARTLVPEELSNSLPICNQRNYDGRVKGTLFAARDRHLRYRRGDHAERRTRERLVQPTGPSLRRSPVVQFSSRKPRPQLTFSYQAYGLSVESAFPFPELSPGTDSQPSAVRIENGPVDCPPVTDPESTDALHISDTIACFQYEGIGVFRVQDGRVIRVDPNDEVREAVLRRFVLGPAFGVLLNQRGFLVVHASAVSVHSRGALFLGEQGAGKSTLAASISAREGEFLTDDVAAISVNGGPVVRPGFPAVKLDPGARTRLESDWDPIGDTGPDLGKPYYRVTDRVPSQPRSLEHVYVLEFGDGPTIAPVSSQEAFIELVRHSYPSRLLEQLQPAPCHFVQCAALARAVQMKRFTRLRTFDALSEASDRIIADLGHE